MKNTFALLLLFATAPIDISRQTRNIIWVNGQPVGATGAINIAQSSGPGCSVVWGVTPNPSANRTDVTAVVNTACVPSRLQVVQQPDTYCPEDPGGTGTCSTSGGPAAWCQTQGQAYVIGSVVYFVPSLTAVAAKSLNVNQCGALPIKLSDGATDPGPLLIQGRGYTLHVLSPTGTLEWVMEQGDSHQ